MTRKVFISFLGTNEYTECNYIASDGTSYNNIKYVQEATIKHYCSDYDKFIFFLTKDAKSKNWKGDEKLYSRISNLEIDNIKNKIVVKDIPDGFTLDEIWNIFQIVFDEINNDDELIFDITHAFRYLPMLGMVLINYLKVTKSIQVNGIYYGAFEALGPSYKVKEINIEERNVDILDLKGFSLIQDWAYAANNLYEFGNVNMLTQLVNAEIKPILAITKGADIDAANLRNFINPLPKIFEDISTVRLKEIFKSKEYNDVKKAVSSVNLNNMPQLKPLILKIQEKVESFKDDENILNGFQAVKLCIDYGWIQQAYTLLIETTVSYILDKLGYDWQKEKYRNILNSSFSILIKNTPESEWKNWMPNNTDIMKEFLDSPLVNLLSNDFNDLINCRNDINHAGIRNNPMSTDKLCERIEIIYCNILSKII